MMMMMMITMAESVAVYEIFSVKESCDLENQVRDRSRTLKMAPFDRPYATFYSSAISSSSSSSSSSVLCPLTKMTSRHYNVKSSR